MTRHRQLQWIVAIASVLAAAIAAFAQTGGRLPADLDPDSRARLPYLQRKDLDAKSQEIFDKLPGRGQDGVLRGPLAFAAYNPGCQSALRSAQRRGGRVARPARARAGDSRSVPRDQLQPGMERAPGRRHEGGVDAS